LVQTKAWKAYQSCDKRNCYSIHNRFLSFAIRLRIVIDDTTNYTICKAFDATSHSWFRKKDLKLAAELLKQRVECLQQAAEMVKQRVECLQQAAEMLQQRLERLNQAAELLKHLLENLKQAAELVKQRVERHKLLLISQKMIWYCLQ
jgi:predicted nuclease with TOPRIM domain